ncbi:MAG: hypothetical protein GXP63_05530, partial [DPANN group archaeon]|nr:hypothetical protein [DPANN group archaeon]
MKASRLLILLFTLLASTGVASGKSILDTITQATGGINTPIVMTVINAAVLGILFFIVVSFVKGKDADQKVANQLNLALLAMAIIIAIAIGDKFIWNVPYVANFLHAKVAINTGIYFGLFYLAYVLFIKKKVEEKGAGSNMAAIIAILILSLTISMGPFSGDKTWDQVGPSYQYLWQKEDVVRLRWFAFGNPDTGDSRYTKAEVEQAIKADNPDYPLTGAGKPEKGEKPDYSSAVLKGTGLFIFLFGTLLLIWLFSELELNKNFTQLNWILAIFIASNIANAGMEKSTFVNLAMVL